MAKLVPDPRLVATKVFAVRRCCGFLTMTMKNGFTWPDLVEFANAVIAADPVVKAEELLESEFAKEFSR